MYTKTMLVRSQARLLQSTLTSSEGMTFLG
jgi:hypothetical protein